MFPGVGSGLSLASLPTASTSPVFLLMATMDGSLTTMPLPRAYTSVLAVPRSMARSLEKMLNSDRRLWKRPPLEWNRLDDIRLTSLSLKSDDCLSVAAVSHFRSGGLLPHSMGYSHSLPHTK